MQDLLAFKPDFSSLYFLAIYCI